jgi:protoporphyrinogen oxidase
MKSIGIIGGGISGISLAKMLESTYDVTVLEREQNIGGLIKCERINDNLFHKVGGHIFNAKNSAVSKWFWDHFDQNKEFTKAKRNAKILFGKKIIGYPLENFLYELERITVEAIVNDLIAISKSAKKALDYYNFEEFLKGNFGPTLYNLYFKPYNEKLWKTSLAEVSLDWLEGKLPMPDFKQILLSNIRREEETEMVHSTFYYPVQGGSQFIIDRLAEKIKIIKNAEVKKIEKKDNKFFVNDTFIFDTVVFCGDVRTLEDIYLTKDVDLNNAFSSVKKLKSNGTSNLFCETDETDLSWLYIPDNEIKAHRIIYTGNFSPTNNLGSKRSTCVVEFSGQWSYDDMCKELDKLPGNLAPIGSNSEPNSYVIQDHTTRGKINELKRLMEKENFYLLGRFAEWEYYNMDKCIEAAMALMNKLCKK